MIEVFYVSGTLKNVNIFANWKLHENSNICIPIFSIYLFQYIIKQESNKLNCILFGVVWIELKIQHYAGTAHCTEL